MVGRVFGHYRIVELMAAGGMGEVYRAIDTRLGRAVAIKVLPAHLAANPEALRRFEREARTVAALSHPNILSIHDFGSEQGIRYAVMELLEGETLKARLRKSVLDWREAVTMAASIADGLAAAHAKGVIHRDLKPANIFLTTFGQVKILGSACPMEGGPDRTAGLNLHLPTTNKVRSSAPSVISPEQARRGRRRAERHL